MTPSTTASLAHLAEATSEQFAGALTATRKAAGLRQNQLAEELELSPRTVMRWEGGKAMPRVDVRDRIVAWLRARPGPEAELALAAMGSLFVRPAPPPPPAPPSPSPEATRDARLALEQALYRAAEAHDVPARAARQIVLAVLVAAEIAAIGPTFARTLLAVDATKA